MEEGSSAIEKWDEGRRLRPTQILRQTGRACVALLPSRSLKGILQPGERNEEERRQKVPQQEVHPREGEIESAEAESSPERAKR